MRTLSTAAVASMMAESTGEVWLCLIAITHADLAQPIYVANNNENIVSNGISYVGLPFSITLPGEDGENPGEATIEVPNVTGEIVNAVRIITSPPAVVISVVLASSPDTVEVSLTGLTLFDSSWDSDWVRGTLRFETLVIEPISETITPERFPSLF